MNTEAKWIRWTQWQDGQVVNFGQMPMRDMQKNLQKFETEAKKLLEKTGADHILYGCKYYDPETGEVDRIHFYLDAMTEEEFEENVANISGVTIYALHKR